MKILVVDDERTLVKGIKFNLENEGYQVECAYDGAASSPAALMSRGVTSGRKVSWGASAPSSTATPGADRAARSWKKRPSSTHSLGVNDRAGLHIHQQRSLALDLRLCQVEEILYCMLIVSANEACVILAEAVSGSADSFVEAMNAKAEVLDCQNTHFVNPHGLHDPRHYTSAWDMYLITQEALTHEEFLTICDTREITIPATNLRGSLAFSTV